MKFSVIVTRETTESTVVLVSARSAEAAEAKALEIAESDMGSNVAWTPDDCSGLQSDPYTTGVDPV